jgi:hypothetical protein
MIFKASRPITPDIILTADLSRYPIRVVKGKGATPYLQIVAEGAALRVELVRGHCFFSVAPDGQFPGVAFQALEHAFDCTFEKVGEKS